MTLGGSKVKIFEKDLDRASVRKIKAATKLADAETNRFNAAADVLHQMGELNRATARKEALDRAKMKEE